MRDPSQCCCEMRFIVGWAEKVKNEEERDVHTSGFSGGLNHFERAAREWISLCLPTREKVENISRQRREREMYPPRFGDSSCTRACFSNYGRSREKP